MASQVGRLLGIQIDTDNSWPHTVEDRTDPLAASGVDAAGARAVDANEVHTDMVTLLASRLSKVESELQARLRDIRDRDVSISILQSQVEQLKSMAGIGGDASDYIDDIQRTLSRLGVKHSVPLNAHPSNPSRFPFNMKRLQQSILELNLIAGDGVSSVVMDGNAIIGSAGGAKTIGRLKAPDPIPLLDGYFPYELKDRYPDGGL
ncbi:hypothetical protein BC831DRAFT_515849 [Entophlyctis helioformis]|nr:hypothetical protein BC831DRAFT_515849 [Entophlyctis helioformis]